MGILEGVQRMRVFLRGVVLRVLYPILMLVGAFLGSTRKERLQSFVIRLNNRLVRSEWSAFRKAPATSPEATNRILLLLPHCLQTAECDIRLTHRITNCKRCGKCPIKGLLEIAEERHLNIFVATGGTIARRVVKDVHPDAILAIACERDLSSGIVDTYPLPVLGISNDRPCGPCINTQVDLGKVKEALAFFGSLTEEKRENYSPLS